MDKPNVALVPLRGGSKSIPNKNIKLIAGKPLCYYVLNAAKNAPFIDNVYVSTDSSYIAEIVESLKLGVKIIWRPQQFSTDTASTESVMLHFAQNVDFSLLVTLQATSPLTTSQHLVDAYKQFDAGFYDSLVTTVPFKRFLWTSGGIPLNYDPQFRPRRQDFEGAFVENGAFYFTKRAILMEKECRLGGKVLVYAMPADTYTEIDEPQDWDEVEKLLLKSKRANQTNIKMLVCDVDGTLTDGGMYYSENGECLKKFNTRDAKGLKMLRESGVEVVILTKENSKVVTARMEKLKIKNYFPGIQQKLSFLQEFCSKKGLDLSQVAYIGDDVNDLECLSNVGFSACPSDAVPEIKVVSDYICRQAGGDGAVREICSIILELNKGGMY